MTVPIAPQNTAPPIDSARLDEFYAVIDAALQNPQSVSDALVPAESDLFATGLVSLTLNVPLLHLNVSEKEKFADAYRRAGWKEARVLEDGLEGGKGIFSKILLRAAPEVMAK